MSHFGIRWPWDISVYLIGGHVFTFLRRIKWPFMDDIFPCYAKAYGRNYLILLANMSQRWERKRAQLKNLESARKVNMSDFSTRSEEEDHTLPMETLEQTGFVTPARGELTTEDGDASEESEEMNGDGSGL